ncbi:hypothetical protein [Winogradskyella rapida]|uniref:Uncharacterized protein n=1 Tax=Winogradskyella rapida TaxID=549701 RepID=A0ABW3KUZ3_9FLAO
MSINWELSEPMPHYFWNDAAKLSIGQTPSNPHKPLKTNNFKNKCLN